MIPESKSYHTIHIPVLKNKVIHYLRIQPGGVYIDGTIGLGGHAAAILSELSPKGMLVGFDGDEEAINCCKTNLPTSSKYFLFNAPYHNFPQYLSQIGIRTVDGMLLDLGISSLQIDSRIRGFSYRFEAPLDMRFNTNQTINAKSIINSSSEKELTGIFRKYGEENRSARIARKIVAIRQIKPITTTIDLKNIVSSVVGSKNLNKSLSRIFQSLRITVNNELKSLKKFLEIFQNFLKPGGRIVVLSYHSLEDRLIKHKFKELAKGCVCPPDLPVCICGKIPELKIITKRAIIPGNEEIQLNKRARSAKLRVAEKIA